MNAIIQQVICVLHFLIKQLPYTWLQLTQTARVSLWLWLKHSYFYVCWTGLAVLRRNFTKLCHCLPQDFKQTINKIKELTPIRDEIIYRLLKLPSFELANCHILALLITPVPKEADLIRFCDLVENLVNDTESKRFISKLRNGQCLSSHFW